MSFIDMMADHVWSEADIVNRMESMIRSSYSRSEESIINRKITGSGLGFYTLTADEQAEIGNYASVCSTAQEAGRAARVDMALLTRVFELEAAQARLALAPAVSDDPDIFAQDTQERAAAQAVLDSATQPESDLLASRLALRTQVPADPVSPPTV